MLALDDKINAVLTSDKFIKKIAKQYKSEIANFPELEEIGNDFIRIYKSNADASIFTTYGRDAVDAGLYVESVNPQSNTRYNIYISHKNSISRSSLSPGKTLNSVVSLFETGYDTITKERPRGIWRDKRIIAKASWDGTGFVSKTLSDFENKYAYLNATAKITNTNFVSTKG